MGDIHQAPLFDLRVALGDPGGKAPRLYLWMMPQGHVNGVNDIVQEIRFIAWIATRAGEDHPIGAAGIEQLDAGSAQLVKQVPAGATVARRLSSNDLLLHGL